MRARVCVCVCVWKDYRSIYQDRNNDDWNFLQNTSLDIHQTYLQRYIFIG